MAKAPYGRDTLEIPVYLAQGDDDPGLAAWKREHPDWFVAGTWSASAPQQPVNPPRPGGNPVGQVRKPTEMAALTSFGDPEIPTPEDPDDEV